MRLIILSVLVHAAAVLPAVAQTPRTAAPRAEARATDPVPPCRGDQVSVRLDDHGGNFAGMSQNGADLRLRNTSAAACRVSALPQVSLSDSAGVVPATPRRSGTDATHPGPVDVPVVVAPGAEVTSALRWTTGPVFDHNVCRTPTTLSLVVGGETKTAPFGAQLCGDGARGGIRYDVTRFEPDAARRPRPGGG